MLRGKQIDLNDQTPSPFSLIFAIYGARLPLTVAGFHQLDIGKQCEYLQNNRIQTKALRKQTVTDLVEKEENFNELTAKSYIRIHVKYILRRFFIDMQRLKREQNIKSWDRHQIILSFISHLIDAWANDESANKKATTTPKIWEFVNYLRRYFNDSDYDGEQFMAAFRGKTDGDKPAKGFGLQMMKTVCNKYTLKSGPYSKVKKQCNIWATNIHKQSEGNGPQQQPPPQIQVAMCYILNCRVYILWIFNGDFCCIRS